MVRLYIVNTYMRLCSIYLCDNVHYFLNPNKFTNPNTLYTALIGIHMMFTLVQDVL